MFTIPISLFSVNKIIGFNPKWGKPWLRNSLSSNDSNLDVMMKFPKIVADKFCCAKKALSIDKQLSRRREQYWSHLNTIASSQLPLISNILAAGCICASSLIKPRAPETLIYMGGPRTTRTCPITTINS
uniref:(northern house mosquito) hypothetical protein n=1 Tax=Culex pipiens TaxID=7175 RepID=A0A8D8H9P9_CULPI